jgi:hypothetical protein
MEFVPNFKIYYLANDYLRTAELCVENDLFKPAIMNAVFSCELYLKSFLAVADETVILSVPVIGDNIDIVTSHPSKVNGHKLFQDLYKKIPEKFTKLIDIEGKIIDATYDLEESLKKYESTFISCRYAYESSSEMPSIKNYDILHLARHLKQIVWNVSAHTHPK